MAGTTTDELNVKVKLDLAQADADLARFKNGMEATFDVAGRAVGGASGGLSSIAAGLLGGLAGGALAGAAKDGSLIPSRIGGALSFFGTAVGDATGLAKGGTYVDAVKDAQQRMMADFGLVGEHMSGQNIREVFGAYFPLSRMEAMGRLRIQQETNPFLGIAVLGEGISRALRGTSDAMTDSIFR